MGAPKIEEVRHGEPASGYIGSALIFIGLTALFAVIVRDDPFYRSPLFGLPAPAAAVSFLILMPLAGFLIGHWRYDRRHHGGSLAFAGKLIARGVHFTYAHFLIVLFAVAAATDYFLGLNLDEQVKAIDDRSFDFAARFAPWLCAYLAGFNLGRAMRIARDMRHVEGVAGAETSGGFVAEEAAPVVVEAPKKNLKAKKKERGRKSRIEPPSVFLPAGPETDQGDLGAAEPGPLTSSGLPQARLAPAPVDQGFLPPQDFSKLRPSLRELR
jgi:hypothetical protein